MAIHKIIRMGHPVLRKKAQKLSVEEILSDETRVLIGDMEETMATKNGVGLAAPQIGISKQLAIIHLSEENSKRYSQKERSPLIVVINPTITILNESTSGFWEGCLSIPKLRGFVERPNKIQVDFVDQGNSPQSMVLEGFLATVFQHELDHLEGKLYIDHIKDMKNLTFFEEYKQFFKENTQSC